MARGILEMAQLSCRLQGGRFLALSGPGDQLRLGRDFVAGKGFVGGETVDVTGADGSIGEVQVIFMTGIAMAAAVPLVDAAIAPSEAMAAMRNANVSAVVTRVDDAYYLMDAGSAWVAWKKGGDRWNPAESGVRVPTVPLRPRKGKQFNHFGPVQVDTRTEGGAMLVSKHPHWIARYSAGPTDCYCLKCKSGGLPGTCAACGGEMLCTRGNQTAGAKRTAAPKKGK